MHGVPLLPSAQPPSAPHVVSQGDVGTPGQQHADHIDVLVLRSPDDGCPAPTVLVEGRRKAMKAQTGWPENRNSGALLETAKAREWGIPQMYTPPTHTHWGPHWARSE